MAVAKVVEVTAASKRGLEDAVRTGIERTTETLDQVSGAWVQDIKVTVENGEITEWRVNMKVTFVLR